MEGLKLDDGCLAMRDGKNGKGIARRMKGTHVVASSGNTFVATYET